MKIQVSVLIVVVMVTLVGVSGVVNVIGSTAFAQKPQFVATLTGKSATPPNLSTNAMGKAFFTVTDGGNKMAYSVNASKINGVTDVVLLYSTGGRSGDVVDLRTGTANGTTGAINGPLVQGTFTSSKLLGPLTFQKPSGKTISDLAKAMLDGQIYLRISTVKFPL